MPAPPIISDYSNGGFTVGGEFHEGSIIITGADDIGFSVLPWVEMKKGATAESLTTKTLKPIYESPSPPMLILIGVGDAVSHPFSKFRAAASREGIAVEILTTPAACRTWNLLLSEGRRASLAVMALPKQSLTAG